MLKWGLFLMHFSFSDQLIERTLGGERTLAPPAVLCLPKLPPTTERHLGDIHCYGHYAH